MVAFSTLWNLKLLRPWIMYEFKRHPQLGVK